MISRPPSNSTATLRRVIELERRYNRAHLIVLMLIIGLLGAALGGVAFELRSQPATSTALLRLSQPPDFAAVASGAGYSTPNPQPITQGYIAGEVEFLSGEKFISAVAESGEVGEFTVTQSGNSSVVSISSSAKSPDGARAILQSVIDVYEQQLAQRVETQLRGVLPALDQWSSAAVTDGLRLAEISRLREAILVQAQQARTVTVLQPPVVDDKGTPLWVSGAALGAVVSVAAVWLLALVRKRWTPLSLVSQVAELVDGVILPPVKLRGSRRKSPPQISLARTIYAQIGAPGTDQTVAVLGVAPRSGTAVIAELIRIAAADSGSVPTIDIARDQDDPVLADATRIVVVVRIDTDRANAALSVLSAVAATGATTLVAFTYPPRWRGLFTFRFRRLVVPQSV